MNVKKYNLVLHICLNATGIEVFEQMKGAVFYKK